MIDTILRIIEKLVDYFTKKSEPKKVERTSERIDEGPTENVGDLTMIADKMLERLNKKRKK